MEANNNELKELLLSHGANPLMKDESGQTPFSLAPSDGIAPVALISMNSIHHDFILQLQFIRAWQSNVRSMSQNKAPYMH